MHCSWAITVNIADSAVEAVRYVQSKKPTNINYSKISRVMHTREYRAAAFFSRALLVSRHASKDDIRFPVGKGHVALRS